MNDSIFTETSILLPGYRPQETEAWTKWAAIACDQFTSDPEYWITAEKTAAGAPSTLRIILPEAYLGRREDQTARINAVMLEYMGGFLREYPSAMIYVERTLPDSKIRRGVVGAFDLEAYDYTEGSLSPIRATEGTVIERIPPRVAIRKNAPIELPHVMVLADDPGKTAIEPLSDAKTRFKEVYDFDLMLGGGHITGYLMDAEAISALKSALAALKPADEKTPWFAVGDGNHSLAAAKAHWQNVKAALSPEEELTHPARYALAELVNLHDSALVFEPIYRVVFGCDPADIIASLNGFAPVKGDSRQIQKVRCVTESREGVIEIAAKHPLTVGTLQLFLDEYVKTHEGVTVDYIHGMEEAEALGRRSRSVAFIFDGMDKSQLFFAVAERGALPRKTFSMGEARSKRYYIEARSIIL